MNEFVDKADPMVESAVPLPAPVASALSAGTAARQQAVQIRRKWRELCTWDPALPPDATPPRSEGLVLAVASALDRPQPLGWGIDPAVESVVEDFATTIGAVDEVLAMLVCLREAISSVVIETLAPLDRPEAERRLQMIIERSMIAAAHVWTAQLSDAALTDPLTGLGNRRAFDQDLERHAAFALRHQQSFAVAIVDVDGLKTVNDISGHGAGDETLRQVATGLRHAIRAEDGAYRLGGDEFSLLLVADHAIDADILEARLAEGGVPRVTIGIASSPPEDASELVDSADARMYERRRARRGELTS